MQKPASVPVSARQTVANASRFGSLGQLFLALILYTALPSATHMLSVQVAASSAAGTCSGAGANPSTYNFEINGYPAKVLNDQPSVQLPVTRGIFLGPDFFVDRRFFDAEAAVLRRMLRRRFEDDAMLSIENHILYIDVDGEGVLIDAGMGAVDNIFGPGLLFDLLEVEGIPRDSIKHVLVTHGHPDHLGGLLEDLVSLEPSFPNATVHISRIEYEYWTSSPVDNGTSTLPADVLGSNILFAQTVLALVKDQLSLFEMDEELIPGIKPISTPWHTPGSAAYAVEDGNSTLVFTGDSLTHKILSIENPWVPFFSDWLPEMGPEGRYALLDEAVREGWQLLSGHSSFPGLLYVDNQGVNFQTTAAGYQGSGRATSVCV